MKKFIFLMAFSSMSFLYNAQTMNEIPAETTVYCDVVSRHVLMSFTGKVKVDVDFGQAQKAIQGINYNALKDADGKSIIFNSAIDAINYMSADGWMLVNTYTVTNAETKEVHVHFIMKKSVTQK